MINTMVKAGAAMKRVYIIATSLGFDDVEFQIPEWNNGEPFSVLLKYIPGSIRLKLHPGFACFVEIDEQAKDSKRLHLCRWSLHREI